MAVEVECVVHQDMVASSKMLKAGDSKFVVDIGGGGGQTELVDRGIRCPGISRAYFSSDDMVQCDRSSMTNKTDLARNMWLFQPKTH